MKIATPAFIAATLTTILCIASMAADPKPNDPGSAEFAEYWKLLAETKGKIDDRHLTALRKSAQQGHQEAQGVLGVLLVSERGRTDPKALDEGVSWLKRVESVDKPQFDSVGFMLALCYISGMGTDQDIERAGILLARTAPRGNSDMKLAYATFILQFKKDTAKAKGLLSEVAKDTTTPAAQQEAKEILRSLP